MNDNWTCIPGRICGGAKIMADKDAEIARLKQASIESIEFWKDAATEQNEINKKKENDMWIDGI